MAEFVHVEISVAAPHIAAGEFPLQGYCDEAFLPAFAAFKEGYLLGEEIGSAVSIAIEGRQVASFWGGYKDEATTRPWEEDTIVVVFANARMLAGVALMRLADQGAIALDAPVSTYWPEFAQAGKEKVTVRFVMDHRAGLPVLMEDIGKGAMYDARAMSEALARATPLWEPGTKAGYHSLTGGHLMGEIVRRVTGKTIGRYCAEEICRPLNADFFIGLDAAKQVRCADFIGGWTGTHMAATTGLMADLRRQLPDGDILNTPEYRQAEIASGNGHASARGIERIISMLCQKGTLDGHRILSPQAVEAMTAEQYFMREIVGERDLHQALCLIRTSPPWYCWGPNPESYGAQGFGGSVSMCDPATRMTFAYVCNKSHKVFNSGPRAERIKGAIYACLGKAL